MFQVDEHFQMTEQELLPEDLLPAAKFPADCVWARPSILAVLWAFHRSQYFMINFGHSTGRSKFGVIELKFDLIAVNRGMKHRNGELHVEVSPKHLSISIKSTEVPFNASKKWMHGYGHRPKWKKFGTWACNGLLQRQVREEVFEVMES